VIYADTSYWVAWLWEGDEHHLSARRLHEQQRARVWVTHRVVLARLWIFVYGHAGHDVAVQVVDELTRTPLVVVEEVDHPSLEEWLAGEGQGRSFAAAVALQSMRALGISEVLSFEDDLDGLGPLRLRA